MNIPTIDRELYNFRYATKWYWIMQSIVVLLLLALIGFGLFVSQPPSPNFVGFQDNSRTYRIIVAALGGVVVIRLFSMNHRRKTRIEVQGDQIRLFSPKGQPEIEQSLRNIENLTIRIKGGAIGIASWRRIDFKDGKSIIFDGQVENVEKLEDLLTERSGKQFLRWLTGEAYQKPTLETDGES